MPTQQPTQVRALLGAHRAALTMRDRSGLTPLELALSAGRGDGEAAALMRAAQPPSSGPLAAVRSSSSPCHMAPRPAAPEPRLPPSVQAVLPTGSLRLSSPRLAALRGRARRARFSRNITRLPLEAQTHLLGSAHAPWREAAVRAVRDRWSRGGCALEARPLSKGATFPVQAAEDVTTTELRGARSGARCQWSCRPADADAVRITAAGAARQQGLWVRVTLGIGQESQPEPECVSTEGGPAACCELCSATLGCRGWTSAAADGASARTECCLVLALSPRPPPAGVCVGELMSPPCEEGCLPLSTQLHRGTGEDDELQGADTHAPLSAAMFPWQRTAAVELQRLRRLTLSRAAGEARDDARAPEAPARVAVCAAGHARTFVHPAVWGSLSLVRGPPEAPLDLFLVLGTSAQQAQPAFGLSRPAPPPNPTLLARAIAALAPTATKIVPRPSRWACDNPATAQFDKWADCVDLLRSHEVSACGGLPRYDYLFKIRPDVMWLRPVDLPALAARLPSTSTLLGSNDVALLVHRSHWSVLTRLRAGRVRCEPRCNGRSMPVIRRLWRGGNEYCLFASAVAAAGLLHVENSHPSEAALRLTHPTAPWAWATGSGLWSIVRFNETAHWAPMPRIGRQQRVAERLDTEEPGPNATQPVSFTANSPLDPQQIAEEVRELTTVPVQERGGAKAHAARLHALHWYANVGLLGGVTCEPATSCGNASIVCWLCSNVAHLTTQATLDTANRAVAGAMLTPYRVDSIGTFSNGSLPAPLTLGADIVECPDDDPFASAPGHVPGVPAKSRPLRSSYVRGHLRALRLDSFAAAERACHVASQRQAHCSGRGAAAAVGHERDCDELLQQFHPLADLASLNDRRVRDDACLPSPADWPNWWATRA